jgi:hypothetical protein
MALDQVEFDYARPNGVLGIPSTEETDGKFDFTRVSGWIERRLARRPRLCVGEAFSVDGVLHLEHHLTDYELVHGPDRLADTLGRQPRRELPSEALRELRLHLANLLNTLVLLLPEDDWQFCHSR